MLDARIQETLIACVQKAVEAIREYTGGKEKLKADLKQGFTLHTDVKNKATVLFGDQFGQMLIKHLTFLLIQLINNKLINMRDRRISDPSLI
jgi:hypothetical protein